MFLYNSDNCHYDLLVEENSRLAILGLITMEEEEVKAVEGEKEATGERGFDELKEKIDPQWKTVQGPRNVQKPPSPVQQHKVTLHSDEQLLAKGRG